MAADPNLWLELVRSLPGIVTACTAVAGVWIGVSGLGRWRRETIGRRRAELAEEVLADFYQANDIITRARNPGGWADEGKTREASAFESEAETQTLNSYFRTAERMFARSDFFATMDARRFRAIALFGSQMREPYEKLERVRGDILAAVQMLILSHREQPTESMNELKQKWMATIGWCAPENDPITPRLAAIQVEAEAVCRPAIEASAINLTGATLALPRWMRWSRRPTSIVE